ncbi:hypothetical protein SBOR_2175 [Sclerotinia borealis F-4128]|uniref:Arca-like protein n=1 Tax=Sclerotinia borealis (strain F-4128) TaxID=1432307 RepID=W9CNR6_SCLBF|nr:hypothetical protein SBOR_2175 [Sclerotinia borealis F-4128]
MRLKICYDQGAFCTYEKETEELKVLSLITRSTEITYRISALEQNHIEEGNSESSSPHSFGNLRFRHGSSARYDSDFKDHVWVKTSGKICSEFVDELPELYEIYTTIPKRENTATPNTTARRSKTPQSIVSKSLIESASTSRTKASRDSFPRNQAKSPGKRQRADDDRSCVSIKHSNVKSYPRRPAKFNGDLTESSILDRVVPQPPLGWDPSTFFPQKLNIQIADVDGLYQSETQSIQEACLLRYFVDELACWFDLCDPERHFALVVPHRAKHCPALLNAIYTASARHLCRLGQYQKNGVVEYQGKKLLNLHVETAIEYHRKCIEHLVSASDDLEALYDENLLVASVILRFYEEVDAPLIGGEGETAQRVTQGFITAQASGSLDSSLRRAAFRVAYRQEVHMAFVRQRSFHMPLQCHEYRSFEYADDYTWAYRTIVHCADILQYCYGSGSKTNSDYDMLVQYHEAWEKLRPQSFDALYERGAAVNTRQAFPEIWYVSDCHVTAHQHMDISQILLTTYNPRVPRLGPGHRAASQRIEAQINTMVQRLCGVAISNHRSPPAMSTACMAISMCGEQFTDTEEQKSILEVLRYTENQHAWPTKHIQDRLIEAWGCSSKGTVSHGQDIIEDDMVTIDGWLL